MTTSGYLSRRGHRLAPLCNAVLTGFSIELLVGHVIQLPRKYLDTTLVERARSGTAFHMYMLTTITIVSQLVVALVAALLQHQTWNETQQAALQEYLTQSRYLEMRVLGLVAQAGSHQSPSPKNSLEIHRAQSERCACPNGHHAPQASKSTPAWNQVCGHIGKCNATTRIDLHKKVNEVLRSFADDCPSREVVATP